MEPAKSSNMSSLPQKKDFQVITSIRYDINLKTSSQNSLFGIDGQSSPFYMLKWHRDRLVSAAQAFGREADSLTGAHGLRYFERTLCQHLEKEQGGLDCEQSLKVRLHIPH